MRPKLKIKKDDKVLVIAGKDRGKVGKVLRVLPDKGRVVVEKINMVKRHTRPSANSQGGILEKEAPIHISNVMLVCDKCGKPTRVGRRQLPEGRRVRFCKKCGEQLDT